MKTRKKDRPGTQEEREGGKSSVPKTPLNEPKNPGTARREIKPRKSSILNPSWGCPFVIPNSRLAPRKKKRNVIGNSANLWGKEVA